MLPNNILSSQPIAAEFFTPLRNDPLIDFELGGADIQNTSQGLMSKLWKCFYEDGQIKIRNGDLVHTLIAVENATALGLAFDFNMRPQLTYVANGKTYLWWYDPSASKQVTTEFGASYISPQLSLDEHRLVNSANADIIFAYIRNAKLCYRQQRDRYETEHILSDAKNQKLTQIGMSKNNRFQFRLVFDWRNE